MKTDEYYIKRFELKNMGFNKLSHAIYHYYYYFEGLEIWNNVKIKHGQYTKIKWDSKSLGLNNNYDNQIKIGCLTPNEINYNIDNWE